MEVEDIHPWVRDIEKARAIQQGLKKRLILRPLSTPVRTVAGADVAYGAGGTLYAAVVVIEIASFDLLEEATATGISNFPYRPGFLAFREGPVILEAFRQIRIRPDVALFDGHGVWHPRGVGLASHLGLLLGIPSVGCAKSPFLCYNQKIMQDADRFSLISIDGCTKAAIVRTKPSAKPIYISAGHLISLKQAVSIVIRSSGGLRIPEPLRKAHIMARHMKRNAEASTRKEDPQHGEQKERKAYFMQRWMDPWNLNT